MLEAIDPDSTEVFEVRGAKFMLGVVPAVVWQRVKFGQVMAVERAQRRAIRDLIKDGLPPDATIKAGDKEVSRRDFAATSDPEFRQELTRLMQDLLKFGIRGHEDIEVGGKPLEFKSVDTPLEGTTVKIVAPETMRVYMANSTVMEAVFAALCKRCELSDAAKKV